MPEIFWLAFRRFLEKRIAVAALEVTQLYVYEIGKDENLQTTFWPGCTYS